MSDQSYTAAFVDGPLKGQIYTVDSLRMVYPVTPGNDVTYTLRRFGFNSGPEYAFVWIAYCGPEEPRALAVAEAILRPELFRGAVAVNKLRET